MKQRDRKKIVDYSQIHMFDDLSPPGTVDNSPLQNKMFQDFGAKSPKNGLGSTEFKAIDNRCFDIEF